MIGVNRDRVDDVEVGCTVWSKTIQTSYGHAGGVIVDITDSDTGGRVFHVLRWDGRTPFVHELADDDIDETTVDYFSRPAFQEAQRLFGWLAQQSSKQRQKNVAWADRATRLYAVGSGPNFLPRAEARYRAASAAQREARNAC